MFDRRGRRLVLNENGRALLPRAQAHLPQVRVGLERGSNEAVKRVVAEGVGLGCLSRHAMGSGLDDRRLVLLPTRLPAARRRLATVLYRDKSLGAVTQVFMRHCGAQ